MSLEEELRTVKFQRKKWSSVLRLKVFSPAQGIPQTISRDLFNHVAQFFVKSILAPRQSSPYTKYYVKCESAEWSDNITNTLACEFTGYPLEENTTIPENSHCITFKIHVPTLLYPVIAPMTVECRFDYGSETYNFSDITVLDSNPRIGETLWRTP